MIFFSKRNNVVNRSSNMEACVSILGLILAIGLVGGLSALIYGLVKGNLSGTIGGAIVLGVSAIGSVILAVVFLCCLKNNNVNSNDNQQRSTANQRHNKQNRHQNPNRQTRTEQNSSHEVIVVSGVHKHDNHSSHQQHSNEYDPKKFSPPIQSGGLADSTNSGYGKQLPQSPSKTSSFAFLNQSNGSMNNQSPINSNAKRNNYNRH